MKREMICILCPRGCALTAVRDGDEVTVTGNTCKRGEQYARDEMIHPVRTVTAVVRVINRKDCALSVKTESPIAKEDIFPLMEKLRRLTVEAPVCEGAPVYDWKGTRVIATKSVK